MWSLGKRNGVQKSFAENGQLISSFVFEKNNLIEFLIRRNDGTTKARLTRDSETGRKTLVTFDDNNNSLSSFQFLNDVQTNDASYDELDESQKMLRRLSYIRQKAEKEINGRFTEINGSFIETEEAYNSLGDDLRLRFKFDEAFDFNLDKNISCIFDGNVSYKDKDLNASYEGQFTDGIPIGLHKLTFDNGDNFSLSFQKTGDVKCIANIKKGDISAALNGYLIDSESFVGKLRLETPAGRQVHLFHVKPFESDLYDKDGTKIHSFSYHGLNNYGQVGSRVYYNSKGGELCLIKLNHDANLEGICRISNDDGRLLLSSSYENGFRSGKTIIYHKNGIKAGEMGYQFNKLEGKVLGWYENGENYNPQKGLLSTTIELYKSKDNLWRKGKFKKGHPFGVHYEYSGNGSVLMQREYTGSNNLLNFGILELNFDKEEKEEKDRSFPNHRIISNQDLGKDALEDLKLFKPVGELNKYIKPLDQLALELSSIRIEGANTKFSNFIKGYLSEDLLSDIDLDFKVRLGLKIEDTFSKGVVVKFINDSLPISKSGLKVGDLITKINSDNIQNTLEFFKSARNIEPDEVVKCSVLRDGGLLNFEFKALPK